MKLQLSDMLGYLILLYVILSLSSKGRIDGYGLLPLSLRCVQNSLHYSTYSTQQQQPPQMSSDGKLTIGSLPKFSKGAPVLSEGTHREWLFYVMNGLSLTNAHAYTIIAQPRLDDCKVAVNAVNAELTEAEKWATDNPKDWKVISTHIYDQLLKMITLKDVPAALATKPGDFIALYWAIVTTYRINTRITRFSKIKSFINMELTNDQKFADFVSEIRYQAQDINSMADKEVTITDELQTVVLVEGTRANHEDTFKTVHELIEQADPAKTFDESVRMMTPAAVRAESGEHAAAKRAAAKKSGAATKSDRPDGDRSLRDCYSYRDYGSCLDHERGKCPFKHAVKNNKLKVCPKCDGQHSPKFCPEKANKARTGAPPAAGDRTTQQDLIAAEVKRQVDAQLAAAAEKVSKANTVRFSHQENYDSDEDDAAPAKAKVASETARVQWEVGNDNFWGMSGGGSSAGDGGDDSTPNIGAKQSRADTASFCAQVISAVALLFSVAVKHPFMVCALITLFASLGGGYQATAASTNVSLGLGGTSLSASVGVGGMEKFGFGPLGPTTIGIIETARVANGQHYGTRDEKGQYYVGGGAKWSIDSACTSHICNDLNLFDKKTMKPKYTKIEVADGAYMASMQTGTVALKFQNRNGTKFKVKLSNVLYVPSSSSNLMSVAKLMKANNRLVFDNNECSIQNKITGQVIDIPMVKSMFDLEPGSRHQCKVATDTGNISTPDLWHRRLCHASMPYLEKAVPSMVKGGALCSCEACIKGGIKRKPFNKKAGKYKMSKKPQPVPSTQQRLDKVMADTCTPYPQQPSAQGNKVFFLIMDIHTRKTWIRYAKSKAEFPSVYAQWEKEVQNETKLHPVLFMPDGGTEFTCRKLRKILEESGTLFQTTCPGNPNQNPFVERMNGTVCDKTRKILEQACMPIKYWEDASKYVVEIQNSMPHSSLDYDTPNKRWDPRRPDKTKERARAFGCEVWFLANNSQQIRKGVPKYRKGVFLGFSDGQHGYKILDLASRRSVVTRDVCFVEHKFPFSEPKESRHRRVVEDENDTVVIVMDREVDPVAAEVAPVEIEVENDQVGEPADVAAGEVNDAVLGSDDDADNGGASCLRRSARHKQPVNYAEPNSKSKLRNVNGESVDVGYAGSNSVENDENIHSEIVLEDSGNMPNVVESEIAAKCAADLGTDYRKMTQKQARESALAENFISAETIELACLDKHGTYVQVPIPTNRDVITCRWVYDVKRDGDNNITVFKARLTAHGFKQKEGLDYNETFSAVAQMKSFRIICALARLKGMKTTQVDISNAFLHGVLEEEIYMAYPPGYEGPAGTCLKLKKGLYGLKQSGRLFNNKLIDVLTSKQMGFKQLVSDSQVLYLERGKSKFIITIHVDDLTLTTNDERLRKEVMGALVENFLVKDLGPLAYYLGIKVTTDSKSTVLSQQGYVEKVLAKFNMEKANDAPTPAVPGQMLSQDDAPKTKEDQKKMSDIPYRSLVGSLMYAYIGTRPDIGASLIKAASFNNNPGQTHWTAAKRILRYLKGTKNHGIRYDGELTENDKVNIRVYCDSDWAQDRDDRKSVSGWVVKLANGPVSWSSKKQATRSLSTCEAEFIALTEAVKEVLWLTNFLSELNVDYNTPDIFTDNQASMEWSRNAGQHQRTKHVALKYFFVRDIVRDKIVKVRYISTKENVSDILTKSPTKQVFAYLQPRLMNIKQLSTAAIGALSRIVG